MQLTKAEWQAKKRQGYTSMRDGKRFALMIDKQTGATVLQPVEVIDVINTNGLSAAVIAELAVRLIETAGGVNDDWGYVVDRAGRGWTATEIARAYVRSHFPKGDIRRRRLLVGLTRQGARR